MLDSNAMALAAGLSKVLCLPAAVLGAALCLFGLYKLVCVLRDRDRGSIPRSLLPILVGMVVIFAALLLKQVSVMS